MTIRTVSDVVEFEGERYTLVFDFEVIAEFEEALGISIADALSPPGGGSPMLSRLAKLLLFGLRRNHPDADLNLAGAMFSDPAISARFVGTVSAAMPQGGDVDGEAGGAAPGNRRARRAAKAQTKA